MNEQMAKDDFLATIRAEHQRLEATVLQLSDDRMVQPGVESDWSVKDVLAHLTWWEQRMLQVLSSLARGEKPPSLLQPGEDWDTGILRINNEIFTTNRDRSLQDVREAFERSFQQSVETVAALSERDLFDPAAFGGVIGRPASEIIAGNTYDHYREHGDAIRAWIAATNEG